MLDTVSTLTSYLRQIVSVFDGAVYLLLQYIYTIFFYVAQFNFVDGEMVFKFFGRVQLIIGVFMMFQLSMTIIRGIINPDTFLDSKTGAKNLIMRIVVSLTLLAMLVPINIANPRNEYERRINNHGILFGTLYSLQYRVLNNNTIGRLVFGNENTDYTSSDSDYGTDVSRKFASMVLKSFYMLNRDEDGNFVCTNDSEIEEAYDSDDASIVDILTLADDTCDSSGVLNGIATAVEGAWMVGQSIINPTTIPIHATTFFLEHNVNNEESYVLTVVPLVSTVAGIALCVLIFMMTFDVAVRAMKLAALQLMAPIPIISYMDPKGGKDGAFNSWVKLLTSTYLDLFVRLAVIYFALNIISMLMQNLPEILASVPFNPLIMRYVIIIVIIAVFIFAKEAPKFFKQMLGIKDSGGSFFSAFGTALGLGTAAVGTAGSAVNGFNASLLADKTRQSLGVKDPLTNKDVDPNRALNRGKHILAGIFGGASGFTTGVGAALNAKDHSARAAWDAMQKRNAAAIARGNDGSTMLGRAASTVRGTFMGEGSSGPLKRNIASWEAQQKALSAIDSRVKGEMVKQDWTYGSGGKGFRGIVMDEDGKGTIVSLDSSKFNHKRFMAAIAKANAAGQGYIDVVDNNNRNLRIDMADADIMKGNVLKFNEDDYIRKVTDVNDDKHNDVELMDLIRDAERKGAAGSSYDVIKDENGNILYNKSTESTPGHITTRDDYKKVSEAIGRNIRNATRENSINEANDQHSGNKSGK